MDKSQALHRFWSSFEIPAYDQNSVPDGAEMPYITYEVAYGAIGAVLPLTASVWYRSSSWVAISEKVAEIGEKLGSNGFYINDMDVGRVWITQGQPFAQRMGDPEDDMIRRYYLNVMAEFLTAY